MRFRALVVGLLLAVAALRVADIVVVRVTWPSTERFVASGALGATDVASASGRLADNAAWSAVGAIVAVILAVLLLTRVRVAPWLTRTAARIVLGLYLLALAVWALQRQALGTKLDGKLIRPRLNRPRIDR